MTRDRIASGVGDEALTPCRWPKGRGETLQDALVGQAPPTERSSTRAVNSFGPRDWLFAATLVAAVFAVYQPAWHGTFLWDDNMHVTRPELRSLHGLYRIWFDLKATQQYYPLLHSAFWIEHKLWGNLPLGYHLVNIFLHAMAALMVALILRRLAVPGAYLAAAIFALHPVQVESVAWITEQKNTLSAVFYLGAMMAYLRFDLTRNRPLYFLALGLFVLGLLSKTVTATLPAALLVTFWWQRGRLSWRRNVVPLVPFFILGAAAGVFTAWVERALVGAEGAAYQLTAVERCLIAGRVLWFYLAKLFWPADLIFIYPRWQIDATLWWQYVYPTAFLLLLAAVWALRRRSRGPLAALLFFAGTLFPALGFCNVYPFVYSFVADHFQYLASLGIIALVSAGAAMLLSRWNLWNRAAGYAICLTLLAVLGVLTWSQSRMYADIRLLYQTTIDRNPACWMAYNNLGNVLLDSGRIDDAIAHFQKALEIKSDYAEARFNLGKAYRLQKRFDDALAEYRNAVALKPSFAEAHNNLGSILFGRGAIDEAIDHFRKAVECKPDYADAHNNLGVVLASRGQIDEAIDHFRQAAAVRPDFADAQRNLGVALANSGRLDEAIDCFQKVVELRPDDAQVRDNLNRALAERAKAKAGVAERHEQDRPRP